MWEEGVPEWYQIMVQLLKWMLVCVGHACMLVACVSLTLEFHVIVALHNVDHGCSKVVMRTLC